MTTTPSRALIRAAGAAAVLAAAVLAAPAPAHAAPPPGPVLVCANGICLLNPSGIDSDGDGFSDADETAAGTDPHDPASHPQILQLLDGWFDLDIRPEGFALREVVILPTTAPDGTALTTDLFAFGHQRTDALTRLGLTNPMLAGLRTDNGLRAVVDLGTANTSGGPSVRVGGIDVGLISVAWSSDDANTKRWTDPDGTRHTQTTTKHEVSMSVRGGIQTKTEEFTLSLSIGASGTTSVSEQKTTVKKPDGTTTTTSSSTTVKATDDKNKTTVNVSSTTDAKGGRKETRTETKTVDGKTTTTTTTTTYDADGNEVGDPTTTCTGEECPAEYQSGEIDSAPTFAPGSTVVATPELTRRIEIYLNDHTTRGETPVEIDTTELPEAPQYSPHNSGVIYVDPSNDAVWWTPELTLPDPDEFGGNITFVPGFTPPSAQCLPTQKLPCPA